ncbi:hypothetical protein [Virgibacillus sp. DJP39]|uniref:hypothetical protein n=1 Tax=Virgibacillus sp. DJP39 TaxID=3409790 RepID=UPI003BB6540C
MIGQLFNKQDWRIVSFFGKAHNSFRLNKYLPPNLLAGIWAIYTSHLIKKAVRLFSKYETVITSRLHGHLLACLMDKNNKIIDNSYGKNSNYFKCWTESTANTSLLEEQSTVDLNKEG